MQVAGGAKGVGAPGWGSPSGKFVSPENEQNCVLLMTGVTAEILTSGCLANNSRFGRSPPGAGG